MDTFRKSIVSAIMGTALAIAIVPVLAHAAGPTAHITVYVLRGEQAPKGPDGHGHDMIVPANVVLKAGQPVDLTIVNYDEGAHTITAEKMNLNVMIAPGHEHADQTVTPVTTHYSFTPAKKGVFRWHCLTPCDKGGHYWAMSKGDGGDDQVGYMAGYFIVM
ncbi:hypothetical protein [Burkholderia sp. BE17]|uniref:hypothetical protein n=1 Tax=Burkholderia sp. BE17 TaxID=2656644 RepID=UPI00128CAB6C|nr:hypothetical protein [Burkholderia sp. BE17]MPV66884.1 hypothetical protein [Burkholderia sp. BE17]